MYEHTLAIDLTLDEQALLATFSSRARRELRRAEKFPLSIVEVDGTVQGAALDALLAETFERTGGMAPAQDWARIAAVTREAPTRLRCDRLELDLLRRHAVANGVRLDLTRIEFGLLAALVAAGGDPVSRRDLLREVWNVSFDPGTNVVDVHVNRLRRKLEDAGLPGVVRTVRGQGYAAG